MFVHAAKPYALRAIAPIAAFLLLLAGLAPSVYARELHGDADPVALLHADCGEAAIVARPSDAGRNAELRPTTVVETVARAWRPAAGVPEQYVHLQPAPPQGRSCRVLLHWQHRLVI